jgi:hypothetical protein
MALTLEAAEALVQQMMGRQEEVDKWLPSCYKIERIFNKSSREAKDKASVAGANWTPVDT